MASLLETLQADRAQIASARDDADGRRQTLEAEAEQAKSYDGVREDLAKLDAEITDHDRKISGIDRDIAREQARRERIRTAPTSRAEAEGSEADVAAAEGRLRSQRSRSVSEQFFGSEDWQNYRKAAAPHGKFSDKSRIDSPAVEIEGSILSRRGLVTGGSATSGGAFIVADDTGIFDSGLQERELTVVDLIRRGTTESDVVEYVRQTGFTNNAAVVPEADSVDPSDDTGRKPWSAWTFERVVETVATIAHGEAASLRALSDAGQLRAILDQGLRYGLLEELEDQIVNGDDSGDNFDGITHVTGTLTQIPAVDLATTIRKAKTKVRFQGKARANAVLLNPLDWETLDLWMTFEGPGSNYRQAAQQTAPTIWGLTVVETEAVAEGTAIVGDFRYAMLWDREQTTVRATQGYEDFFMKNLVAILAEMRAAFGVLRPKAFAIADISSFGS
jgi:HK97 family phage major capsid protein